MPAFGDPASLLWFLFLFSTFLWPAWARQRIHLLRLHKIHELQRRRGTRVITLIHRQEALSLLGIPLARYITVDDSEQVLRAIRLTPDEMPIDLILHTPGGLVLAAEQIAAALRRHPGKVTVFVPHYAMSGGTMLALAADEIVLDENAVLGPVDPQLGNYPAVSILRAVDRKPVAEVDDETLILADVAAKALRQVQEFVRHLVSDKLPPEEAESLTRELTEGNWTHDYPITLEKLQRYGLPARAGLPREV